MSDSLYHAIVRAPETPYQAGGCDGCQRGRYGVCRNCEQHALLDAVQMALAVWPLKRVDAALAAREDRLRRLRRERAMSYTLPRWIPTPEVQ